jgi:hypothetical protein
MSSGKVKCTCGWSWNKSDSSKKDMYICHECGRDNSNNMKNGGWLDNYGEEDNYNDSQASAPEGMEGDGFSNVGRNYSPAWGGSFQMGGSVYPVNYVPEAQTGMSMPGSVGFTYARTQGAAPSNGKYAKKTMASAQNGKEMQYYQNGLDFKPKSISRDGSVIKDDRGQWDHPGEVTEINSNEITMQPDPKTGKPLTRPLLGVSDTGDVKIMRPGGNYKFKGKKVTEYPIAKNGLRQEQKGLQNLDNLTNFTNYNTKQPGGWLDNL